MEIVKRFALLERTGRVSGEEKKWLENRTH